MPQKKSFSDSKLYYSLILLSADEWKQLGRWLQSPWCNSNKKLAESYNLLKRFAPDFSAKDLSKEYLFGKLYPEKEYNDRWIRNILAELNGQIESFLVHQRVNESKELKTLLLGQEWNKRQQELRLTKLAELYQRRSSANKNKSWEDYLLDCYWNDLLYYRQASKQDAPAQKQYLLDANDGLDHFYLLGKMRYLAELKGREQLTAELYDELDKSMQLLNSIKANTFIPAVELYQLKYQEPIQPTEEYYQHLYQSYLEHFDSLSIRDQQIFYFYLLNTRIRMYLGGELHLQKEIFEFYLKGLKKGLLLQEGILSEKTFLNAVTLGNLSQQFKAVEKFIKDYNPSLRIESQADANIWGHSHCYFHQGNFEKVTSLLRDHNFKQDVFDLHGRMLLFQSYCEIYYTDSSYWVLLNNYGQSFDKYIRRLKYMSDRRKKSYLTFSKYVKRIYKSLNDPNVPISEHFNQLKNDIEQEETIQGKKWLLRKIDEILKA